MESSVSGSGPALSRAAYRPLFRFGGNRQAEVRFPAGVVHVIVVKVDRPILLGRVLPVHRPAGPVIALHAPRRHVDGLAVELVGGAVGHADGADIASKVPGSDHRRAELGRVRGVDEGFHFRPAERPVGQPWAVDFAVIQPGQAPPAAAQRAKGERSGIPAQASCCGRGLDGGRVRYARIAGQRLLVQTHPARPGVIAGGDKIPRAVEQRSLGGQDFLVTLAVAQHDGQRGVVFGDDQGEAGLVPVPELGGNDLAALGRRRRPDEGLKGEAVEVLKRRTGGDGDVRAGLDRLPTARISLADRRLDGLFFDARTGRIGIAADDPDHLDAVARQLTVDHERDGFARGGAQFVGVAGNFHARALMRLGRVSFDGVERPPARRPPGW